MNDQSVEPSLIPLEQLGVRTNSGLVAATVCVIGGLSFARLGESGIVLVIPRIFRDHRGSFFEIYHREKFVAGGIHTEFVQDNHSVSVKNVLRGLHYQIQQAQGKLIRATRGEVFDVGVDLRRNSSTFGRWFGTLLSAADQRMLYLPPGFAHGFCTHTDDSEVIYKCTDIYAPQHERTLLWNDSDVAVPWTIQNPILADKDRQGRPFAVADCYE